MKERIPLPNDLKSAVKTEIAAKGGDEEMMLFMTDQQVKHDGKMWNIEEMTEKGGQTIVHLKHGDDRAEVGIEELEAEQ